MIVIINNQIIIAVLAQRPRALCAYLALCGTWPVFNHKILYEPSVTHGTYITAAAIILSLPPPLVQSFFSFFFFKSQ